MKIDVRDLLSPLRAIEEPPTRVGFLDHPALVEIDNPDEFIAALVAAVRDLHTLYPDNAAVVFADVPAERNSLWIWICQRQGLDLEELDKVQIPPPGPGVAPLQAVAERNGGGLRYDGWRQYLILWLPFPNTWPKGTQVDRKLPWDERYRSQLEGERPDWIRFEVFRFSKLAAPLADRCAACGMNNVLVPSVGICVDPWLFASRGLTVTATDSARSALTALSDPARYPLLYSLAAYERWDAEMSRTYKLIPHPYHFDGMPELENEQLRETLRRKITFVLADWARLPVPSDSIDLIFATNAIPRDFRQEWWKVLDEWARVVRRGGILYIAQHNVLEKDAIESPILERGFVKCDFLGGESPPAGARGGFQMRYTSG
jgi:hypothetical protein